MCSSSAIGWFSSLSCSFSPCNRERITASKVSNFLGKINISLSEFLGSSAYFMCVLYLMTRWLWNTAKAGATHLSQRSPIAQCLIHRVNNDIICFCAQTTRNKAMHRQSYSWPLDWRPPGTEVIHPGITAVLTLTLGSRSFSHHSQYITGQHRRAEVPLESSSLKGQEIDKRRRREAAELFGGQTIPEWICWRKLGSAHQVRLSLKTMKNMDFEIWTAELTWIM